MIDLTLLMPEFADKLKEFVVEANYEGLKVDVQSAMRTMAQQADLYAQGRTAPGEIVTNAKPGYSWHNWGVAADVVFRDAQGNFTWAVNGQEWKRLADIASRYGFTWGGSWNGVGQSLGDLDHFQMNAGMPIQTAMDLGDITKVWDDIRTRLAF